MILHKEPKISPLFPPSGCYSNLKRRWEKTSDEEEESKTDHLIENENNDRDDKQIRKMSFWTRRERKRQMLEKGIYIRKKVNQEKWERESDLKEGERRMENFETEKCCSALFCSVIHWSNIGMQYCTSQHSTHWASYQFNSIRLISF